MRTQRTYRHAARMTEAGHRRLDETLGLLQRLYNAALEERIDAWRKAGKSISFTDQCKSLTEIREDDEAYRALPVRIEQPVLRRLDKAMKAFFRRVKEGRKPGFPRFRAAARFRSFDHEAVKYEPHTVRLDRERGRGVFRVKGLPPFRFELRRELPPDEDLRVVRVVRRARRVEVQLIFEVDVPDPATGAPENPVGLDMGVSAFAALSDGRMLERSRRRQKRLRRAQRILSRARRGSGSRRKKRRAFQRAQEREADRRRQELFRLADELTKKHDLIAVEDLRIPNMTRKGAGAGKRGLNRSILEQNWGEFRLILGHKAESAGVRLAEVDPAHTSQDCSGCGARVPKKLHVRVHACPECGLRLDRDVNAARNVLARALREGGWDSPAAPPARSSRDGRPPGSPGGGPRVRNAVRARGNRRGRDRAEREPSGARG